MVFMPWEGCLRLGGLQGPVRVGAWRARWMGAGGPIRWRVGFVDGSRLSKVFVR